MNYAYGDNLNLTGIADVTTPENTTNDATLAYSALGRIETANGPWGTKTFSYDAAGNITQDVSVSNATPPVSTTRVFGYPSSSNKLSTETVNASLARSFTYDASGNMLTGLPAFATRSLAYNANGRPTALIDSSPATVATYQFNAQEQLASRTVTAQLPAQQGTTHYIYDLDGQLIAEAFGTSAATAVITREYIWLDGMPVAVVDGVNTASPVTSTVHTDHLARPIKMTNAAKASVWDATWTPWGTAHTLTGSALQNLRFPGQYFLIEQGLAYNWHRFYDPTTGRYTQPDPLGFVDGASLYAYVKNSPMMSTDEEGLSSRVLPNQTPLPGIGNQSKPGSMLDDPSLSLLGRSCPPSPGDCNQDDHDSLQRQKHDWCDQKRTCTFSMSLQQMQSTLFVARKCYFYRNKMDNKCFRGGDEDHRKEQSKALDQVVDCEKLIDHVFGIH